MVYIKSLICEGFKSFKHRTKINFSEGFTSIVGANGSGKSNILDAFVFALGELSGKTLRVNNIKDLICNGGTESGTPSKWARVDVVFDNSDRIIPVSSNVVKISRKINIKGQGKYYINDKVTTRRELQDIMDLAGLVPNSSNFILQGELFRIINMNHNERRGLIEDISGIAFYNEKKEKAEKDLTKVEENISRITLVLNEVSLQLDSLENEKNDALKYLEHDDKQKKAEKSLQVLKIRKFERQIARINLKIEALKQEIKGIEESLLEKRKNLMEVTLKLDKVNEEIKELQSSELRELTLTLNELKTKSTKQEAHRENIQKDVERLKKDLIKAFKKKDEIEKQRNSLQKGLDDKRIEKKDIKGQLEALKEELFHSEEQVKEFDSEYATYQNELDALKIRITGKKDIKNEITAEIRVLNNKIENSNKDLNSNTRRLNKINSEIESINQEIIQLEQNENAFTGESEQKLNLDELEVEKETLNNKLKKVQRSIDEKHDKLISIRSKIKAVKRFSINKAVETIIKMSNTPDEQIKHNIPGKIYGTIAQLGKADEKYNTALQVAGGNKFNYFVVDTQKTAKSCIQYLKKNRIGRASFIPLDKIRSYSVNFNFTTNDKVIGRAVDLIKFNPVYKKAFEFVFGRTIVVSDIETASNLEIKARRVTLDGDIVEASNLMTGGNNKQQRQGGFGSIAETKIPLLEAELNNMKKQESSLTKQISDIEHQITSSYKSRISKNKEISQIRQALAILRDKLENKQFELEEIKNKSNEITPEITELKNLLQFEQTKLDDISKLIDKLRTEEDELNSKISLLKNNDFTKKVQGLRKNIDELEKIKVKVSLEITKLQTQLDEIISNREPELEADIMNLQESLKTNINNHETLKIEITEINNKVIDLESKLLEKNQEIGELYAKKEGFLHEQTNLKVEIEEMKSKIHPTNIKINTFEVTRQNIESQKEELENSCENLCDNLEEIQEFLTFSQERLTEIITECVEVKLQLEPVNMRAIKKYDKIKYRYDDLIDKHEIIVKERQAILVFIEKVEIEKKNTFMNTFNGINEHFKTIFTKLSPGGEAKLVLENEEDPFAGGIKMLARPGGKKWCLTQSMSGGEKTLTVVALILGIQTYIPSPYYILDEIDAAFDDNNATQVASMIKELSEKSQFILITHRDVTMTKTDQLLGVSNVHGLTMVLNLNIREALEQIAQS